MKKLIGALALLFTGSLYAAPVIESVGAVVEDGVPQVTVTGSGFSDADLKIALKDDSGQQTMFRNGTLIQNIEGDYWGSKGSPWAGPLVPTEVDGEMVYRGAGKAFNGWPNPFKGLGNQSLYVSWKYNPLTESPTHSGGSNKFIRVWDASSGDDTRISWTIMHMTYSGMPKASWTGYNGTTGEWNKMEMWVDAPNKTIKAWINNNLRHYISDFEKVDNGLGLNVALLGFDPNRSTPYKDGVHLYDDIYISNVQSRVVVSDDATWVEASLNGDIQVPVKWADDQVTFYDQGKGKYLYVVDKDGNVNEEGFLLSDPATEKECGKCPAPVGNLQLAIGK